MKTGYFFKHLAGTLVLFSLLFISAGRLDYVQGWVYTIISLFMFLMNYTFLRIDPELLKERSKPGEDSKKWDKAILGGSFLVSVLMFITAGLDSGRFHWSPGFRGSIMPAGIILTASGQLLFLVAQKQNRFFSSTVRVQKDRGHSVCDTGLYSIVRHPAYLGSIIQSLGFPLVLGSLWSFIPVSILIILTILRTSLEDETLKAKLAGYPQYCNKTRYRIIPYVW